ncbi:hypothetical protein Tco_0839211 [Tanacetum coccineum]|uniref:Uncharacterized protein n=1 Tax=Tanacetum coccineum TaxID=301880 RepID=A0ABQ5AV17_9ASTR
MNEAVKAAKTCHAIAANLSELELKKILIDKIENNKSIHRSVQEEALYKHPDWFQKPAKPPTLDRDWKSLCWAAQDQFNRGTQQFGTERDSSASNLE